MANINFIIAEDCYIDELGRLIIRENNWKGEVIGVAITVSHGMEYIIFAI